MGIIKLFALVAVLLVFSSIEKVIPFVKREKSSALVNLSLATIGGGVGIFIYYFFSDFIFPLGSKDTTSFNIPNLALTILALDLLSYKWHSLNHRLTFLWRFHRCHHSEQYMDAFSALRFHFVETSLGLLLKISVIAFLEMNIFSVFCFEVLYLTCNVFQHSNIKVSKGCDRIFQYLAVTPSMHRAHHDLDKNLQNTNFSTIFSFWDRIFKTYSNNVLDQTSEFGVDEIKAPLKLLDLIALPFKPLPMERIRTKNIL